MHGSREGRKQMLLWQTIINIYFLLIWKATMRQTLANSKHHIDHMLSHAIVSFEWQYSVMSSCIRLYTSTRIPDNLIYNFSSPFLPYPVSYRTYSQAWQATYPCYNFHSHLSYCIAMGFYTRC